jgi:hypothetical protein
MEEFRKTYVLAALLTFAIAGCRATPQPVTRSDAPTAKADPAKTAPAAEPPSPAPAAPAPPQEPQPVRDDAPVVVDPGVDDERAPTTLVETARVERERRAQAGRSKIVINDKTLPRHASKGQITIADLKEKEKKDAAAAPTPEIARINDEQYWRGKVLDIRERWRQASDDVKELEQKSTELRQKFYLESDIFKRDNQIKPEWDRVIDKLRQARLDSEAAQKELAEFLEEGRAAGVMPGWLREGEDDEPQEAPRKRRDVAPPAQSIEPPVIQPPMFDPQDSPPPPTGARTDALTGDRR